MAIFDAIAAFPKILAIFEAFASWIGEQIAQAKVRKSNSDMAKAADKAKATKDTSDLDKMFDPDKH